MKNTKNILIASGVLVALYLAYKYVTKPSPSNSGDFATGGDTWGNPNTGGGAVKTENTNDDVTLGIMAQDLFEAMDGCGTTNKKIYEVLEKIKSEQDWKNLIKKYGVRKISATWLCGGDFTGGLIESIKNEMGGAFDTEVKKCNQILQSKGVKTLI